MITVRFTDEAFRDLKNLQYTILQANKDYRWSLLLLIEFEQARVDGKVYSNSHYSWIISSLNDLSILNEVKLFLDNDHEWSFSSIDKLQFTTVGLGQV